MLLDQTFNQGHICAKCSSEQIRRNGHSGGHARYQCKACGHRARFVPAAAERAARCAQVEKLLTGRRLQRGIVRATGVARMMVARLAKKAQLASPPLPRRRPKSAQRKRWEALELDEMWTFAAHKRPHFRYHPPLPEIGTPVQEKTVPETDFRNQGTVNSFFASFRYHLPAF